jgi:hypothetical protein
MSELDAGVARTEGLRRMQSIRVMFMYMKCAMEGLQVVVSIMIEEEKTNVRCT